jgi:hypothetical protein
MSTAEVFCYTKPYNQSSTNIHGRWNEMYENMPKEKVQELKEMIQEKKPKEPVEKVLVKFCERHAVTLETCRKYYKDLVEKGEIKE